VPKEPDVVDYFLKRILRRDTLPPAEEQALRDAAGGVQTYAAGADLASEGDRPDHSTLLIEGFTTRYRLLGNGQRQITALHVPGDFVDLQSFVLKTMDHSVGALSPVKVVAFPHTAIKRITETHPHLTRIMWLLTMLDAAIHREWLATMGGLPAPRHMAHLICEMYIRLQVVGLADAGQFTLPMTQADLGDTLGLSSVHVNRVLQELRADGLISWQGQTVKILDWLRLQKAADFDPSYLHLTIEPR
jgi:CRP-like cAMP-binding protein